MNNIPILVPVKKHSKRCHNKNFFLLPYTLQYLKDEGFRKVVVLSDSKVFEPITEFFGFKLKIIPKVKNDDELKTCFRYLKNKRIKFFAICSVTHPLKEPGLINKLVSKYMEQKLKIDFCTSYYRFKNRRRFFIEKQNEIFQFKYKYRIRSGNVLKKEIKMIDGGVYIMSSKFIETVAKSKSSNQAFWSGRFTCIENNMPFLDIDSETDLLSFKNFLNQFKSCQKLQF